MRPIGAPWGPSRRGRRVAAGRVELLVRRSTSILLGAAVLAPVLAGADPLPAGADRTTDGVVVPETGVSDPSGPGVARDAGVSAAVAPTLMSFDQLVLSPDMTGDRVGDVLTVTSDGRLLLYPGTGGGGVGTPRGSGTGWGSLRVSAPGDWDGDGRSDLVVSDTRGQLFLYPGDGSGGLGAREQIGRGWSTLRIVPAGDVSGDGPADLLAIDTSGRLLLYPGDGTGGFRSPYQVGKGWGGVALHGAGDMNRDGRADILGIDSVGRLWFYAGRGGGGFAAARQVGRGWSGLAFASGADLDEDGLGDLVGRDANGTVFFYAGRDGGSFAARVQIADAVPQVEGLPVGVVVDYQLGGAYPPAAGVGGVVRDSTAYPATGAYSVCYVNGFQTQPDRSGWWLSEHPELVLRVDGQPLADPAWPDELLLDVSTPLLRAEVAEVVATDIERCAERGFDAVEIDNLDSFTRSGGLLQAEDALDLARRYVEVAHAAGLAVGQKNAAELSARAREVAGFDFAVAEECHRWDECAAYTDVYGQAVIDVEYADDLRGTFADVCADPQVPTSTVLRDRLLLTPAEPGHVFALC